MGQMAISLGQDVELVRRARGGDAAAFGALVERHQRLVVAVALAVTGERALAEDAAQEAFVAAWQGLATLREEVRVGPWIAGIARHRALDLLRARGRRSAAHPPRVGGPSYHEPPTQDATAEPTALEPSALDHLLAAEEHELVKDGLAALPEAQRETVILHYFEGRSVRAVADALAVTEDTVKQRLHRAREALRAGVADRLGAALERARPDAAFATGVLAAIGIAGVTGTASAAGTTAVAGKVIAGMTTKQIVMGIGALVLLGGGAFVAKRGGSGRPPAQAAAADPAPHAAPTDFSTPTPARAPITKARKLASTAERDRLVTAIRAARARRLASTPSPSPAPAGGGGSSSRSISGDAEDPDRETIRTGVQEVLPLVKECYEAALERSPKLGGTLLVKFSIEGEPDVGGVIGDSAIDADGTTLVDAEMHECVRETMYALELPPPTGGGVVNVTYPFRFSVDEEDEGDRAIERGEAGVRR